MEPQWLALGRYSIKLRKRVLAKPITVLQMSDLHASGVVPLEFIAKAVRRGLDLKPNLWAGEFSPVSAFAPRPRDGGTPTLVLSHNPDTKEALRAYDWDVMFCGHTHGGQLYLPLLGAPFAPVRDKRFVKGLHAWEGRWIYITKGVGNLLGVRFNCRPEISLVTLH